MCGINGIYSTQSALKAKLQEDIQRMNELIVHRGPDDDGLFARSTASYSLAMAMRRLAIIDLHSGKQPIYNDDKSIVIVFNGEIYNYRALKADLELAGVSFQTASDTEVVLRLYEKYGTAAFCLLDGMFAFSIYDQKEDEVFIVRDFFGEKPLYYTHAKEGFYWASELKSIKNVLPFKLNIDKRALNLYFQLSYIPAPYTIYEGIHKLEANHYLRLDCKENTVSQYEIKQNMQQVPPGINKQEAIKLNHELVQKSVKSRSISDVPLGTFLSGGVDSSIVSLCLAQQSSNKIDTFSIGFDKKEFDESDKAQTVAKLIQSNHHEFIISEKDLTHKVDEILLNFDEPFADSSALATYLVANKTRAYATVALTGDGGDEVYGGYNKYYMGRLNRSYTKLVPEWLHTSIEKGLRPLLNSSSDKRGLKFRLDRLIKSINYDGDFYYNIISLGFQAKELKALLNESNAVTNPLQYYKNQIKKKDFSLHDFRNIDRLISLEGDMLVKVDRTSMLSSLECRAPFLNKTLWQFTNQLPENFLINGWDKKHLLKESFKQYFPKGFLDKSKQGFGVPVGDWLKTILKQELLAYIEPDFIRKQALFNIDYIQSLVHKHLNSQEDNTFRVWTYYCFQKWYKEVYEAI